MADDTGTDWAAEAEWHERQACPAGLPWTGDDPSSDHGHTDCLHHHTAAVGLRRLAQLDTAIGDPGNLRLLADTFDQLGYQSESGPWRDVYLSAAYELRHGPPEQGIEISLMTDILRHTPVEKFFQSLAVRLNGPDAEGVELSVGIELTDRRESYHLEISNAVLHHGLMTPGREVDAQLKLTHDLFIRLLTGGAGLRETLFSDELEVEGNPLDLVKFFSLFDKPEGTFNIVTP